ncbi:MAG: VIT and VWA domain-containing protein [Verrucomicrobiota bacterium]
MKTLILLFFFTVLTVASAQVLREGATHGATDAALDQTEAPYFWIPGSDEGLDLLPLKSTYVDVLIEGYLATVTVRQEFRNEGAIPIEAIYVFPGSTRAAVNDLRFEVGERTIVAEIKEKEEAKKTYVQAKTDGKRAVLLEQHRPNVFQMNVANILPADSVVVELRYTETLPRVEGDYEFVYPTVVGPRYSEDPVSGEGGATDWISSPFLSEETTVTPPKFQIELEIVQGQPLERVGSPSHSIDAEFVTENRVRTQLVTSTNRNDDRDFILRYSLAGKEPQASLLLKESENGGGFFLLNIEPPVRAGSHSVVPREYLFLIDVSGSMNGFPLSISKEIMNDLIGGLGPSDSFNMIAFAGGSEIFSKGGSVFADDRMKASAAHWLNTLTGGGGTSLLPALKRILVEPKREGVSRTVVVLTDGYVTVEQRAFALVRDHLGKANLFGLGIGSSVNRYLIEGLARTGGGEAFVATNPKEGKGVAKELVSLIKNPVLTDISVEFGDIRVSDLLPSQQPDLFLAKPVRVMGQFQGRPSGSVVVSGKQGSVDYREEIDLSSVPASESSSLDILWARAKIREWMDQLAYRNESEIRPLIVELGLSYRLLTAYTSFVAVEQEIVRKKVNAVPVKQPSPLPKGVSALAVGAGVPASPEPTTIGLFLIAVGVQGFGLWKWREGRKE